MKRYQENKIKYAILNKSKDTNHMHKQVDQLSREYDKMMEVERSLMEENNRSLEASQAVKSKYNTLILHGRKRNQSSKLPEISQK